MESERRGVLTLQLPTLSYMYNHNWSMPPFFLIMDECRHCIKQLPTSVNVNLVIVPKPVAPVQSFPTFE